jgi:hypothetical protein
MNLLKLALMGVLALAGSAFADVDLETGHFVSSLRKADFIFEGVVTAVDYKSSRGLGTGQPAMPHTFVTFEIRKVYKGNPGPLQTLTLRFLGGSTGLGGRVMEVSGYPRFDVGDHEILLVERNTRKSCPLALCAQGRFRIIENVVYSDFGNEIDLTPAGALAYGPEHRLPEIDVDMVAGHRMEKMVVEDRPGGITAPPQPPPAGWRHMTHGAFDAFLEATLEANLSRGELTNTAPVATADIRDDFGFTMLRQALPASDPSGYLGNLPSELITTLQEQLELQLFNANGGDPRL